MRFVQQVFGHFFFDATLAEWDGEFASVSVWQDGMIQVVGRKNIDFGHAEVMIDVLIFRVDDDAWMTNRVFTGFVDPRV